MAVKIAHDMNVFPVLAQATGPVPLAELAAAKPADPLLVGTQILENRRKVLDLTYR